MKCMVSCRQDINYIKDKATELKVLYKDKAILSYLVEPDWTFQGQINIYYSAKDDGEIDFTYIDKYKDLLNITLVVDNAHLIPMLKQSGYRAFWLYPITTYLELNSILALGADEVLIDQPLIFDLPQVKKICGEVELRANPIRCYVPYVPRTDGICCSFIRPDDVDTYAEYIDHLEFGDQDLAKERIYARLYSEDKNWPGNLNLLLENLNYNIDNRGFPEDFANKRIQCKQRCLRDNSCHYCPLTFSYITTVDRNKEELIKTYDLQPEDE